MRFMFIVSAAEPAVPTPALVEAMHVMAAREIAAGRMIDDGGLMPQATGARITNARGKIAVTDGPFAETKEVIAGFAVFEVKDRDEGLALAVEFMQLHIDHMPGWECAMEMREVAGSQTRPLQRAIGQ
jgi:hypothetical protein